MAEINGSTSPFMSGVGVIKKKTSREAGLLPRAQYPTAPGFATARSLNQIITYDAYHKAEAFLTQPILAVAGSVAGSKWMSDDLIARAASTDKSLHVAEGANHMDLYGGEIYVAEAVSVLAPFFMAKLSA